MLSRRTIRAIAALLALAQFAASAGFAVPLGTPSKICDRPYPCLDRPCGCLSYDECWAGDCCCFSLEEKVAWAAANGVIPPGHVAKLLQRKRQAQSPCRSGLAEKSDGCPHCKKSEPKQTQAGRRWLSGAALQRCGGSTSSGLLAATLAVPPTLAFSWIHDSDCAGSISSPDIRSTVLSTSPRDPPPRG